MLKQSYLMITIQCINTGHVDITKFEAIKFNCPLKLYYLQCSKV